MQLSAIFWFLMILWFFVGAWGFTPPDQRTPARFGYSFLLFVLLFILGWRVFGFVVQ